MIPKEIIEYLESPDNESQVIQIIKRYLLTEKQRYDLYKLNLSIEDCLNGRYGEKEECHIEKIYDEWNKKSGKKLFGGY